MHFRHSFHVDTPLELVSQFHRSANSLAAITPPPLQVKLESAPASLRSGDEMCFRLVFGPLSIFWRARIERLWDAGFVDRQLEGPFEAWVHTHTFIPQGDNATQVLDEIELQFKRHLFWGALGVGMYIGLPVMFAYRAWKTRRILTQEGSN